MKRRLACLTAKQRGELLHVRDHDPRLDAYKASCDLESGRWLAHPPCCDHWTQLIVGNQNVTLGKTLARLESKIGPCHNSLRNALNQLFGWTSDTEGIR